MNLADQEYGIGRGLCAIASRAGYEQQYLKWALEETRSVLALESTGTTYDAVSIGDVANVRVCNPPLDKQRAIAADLDRETARLDALVAAKTRLVARLGDKRRAVVAQAVTRGLDAEAELRDSGVPWLGAVPTHWEVVRLKHLAQVRGGITKGRKLGDVPTVFVPYLRVANVQDGYFKLDDVTEIEVLEREAEAYALEPGDVLMNEGGDIDKLGRGAVWRGEIAPCLHQNHVFAVRCHGVDPDWLSAFTGSLQAKAYFESSAKRSTNLASISATSIRNLPVPLPPPVEREAILGYLADTLGTLDRLVSRTNHSIALLRTRRAALIAATVTGRRRVPQPA